MKCRVCGSTLSAKYSPCRYCGYNNRAVFTSDADDSRDYRNSILSKLTAFSVTANSYKWNPKTNKPDTRLVTETLFNNSVTGVEMYQDIRTSPVWIAQSDDDKQISLDISYKFGGVTKSVRATITPQHNQVWYIGLQIDENLHLIVYLGDAASKSIPLELTK